MQMGLTDEQKQLIRDYLDKLKWLSQHIEQFIEYKGINVHPKLSELNKETGEPFAEDWIKINQDINELCRDNAEFRQAYEYKLKKLDEEMSKSG